MFFSYCSSAFSIVCACALQVMMRVELLYGLAGLFGSLVSGHLFLMYSSSLGNGTILLSVSTVLHLLCLIFSVALLKVSATLHSITAVIVFSFLSALPH